MAVLIAPAPSATGGTTRRRYRRLLAEELGWWLETVVSEEASSGEATRVVIANELRDDESGYAWPGDDLWLYARDGDQADTQRRVLNVPDTGYRGADAALMLSRPFDDPLAAGVTIEVSSPLPCKMLNGIRGLNEFVNEGLRLSRIEARIPLVGNGGYAYSLAAYPWLTHEGQTAGIYDAQYLGVSDPLVLNEGSTYRIEGNGATRTLVTDYSYASADTFELAVLVRADRLIYDGSAWSYPTTPGLAADTHQAAAPEHWVTAMGMVKALDYLIRLVRADRRRDREQKRDDIAALTERRASWFAAARRIQLYEFPRSPAKPVEATVGVMSGHGWY